MPQVGDLVRITSCSNILSQQACNVFYYVVAAWTGNLTLEDALEVWNDLVAETIAGELSVALTPGTVEWNNIDLPSETASIPGGFRGVAGGEVVSAFAAYSIRQFVETGVTRTGWKRLPGVPETSVANGEITSLVRDLLQTWADTALAAPIEAAVPIDFTLIPVIVGRNPDGTISATAVNPVTSATVQPRMTTQNTRKVGRGS